MATSGRTPPPAHDSDGCWLGHLRGGDASHVHLPASALLRHMMALGSSGSGKTVLCKVVVEECVRRGVPAICIDPQGDICSLLERPRDPALLEQHGIDPATAEAFAERADVVVFTPGARVGVPLCADPIDADVAGEKREERARALSRMAATLTSLLGYELGSDDGDGLCAALDLTLTERLDGGGRLRGLSDVAEDLAERDARDFPGLQRFLSARKLRQAQQRLARLDVGARRLLFHDGLPIDIDMLLGLDERAAPGKTRISVIYLNALEQQEDKELVIAAIADRLYRWMLGQPSSALQALFYIDEVAPFIPPVRKPSCKAGLSLLFKQARKYGVGCLMATQNPGDVDYKAMAQFGTWALGRLTTRQDRKKVEPTVGALAGDRVDDVMDELPRLKAGQFVLLSPDHLDEPAPLSCRWLLSAHETFDERRIEACADERWRERFVVDPPAAPAEVKPAEAKPAEAKPAEAEPAEAKPAKPAPKAKRPKPNRDADPQTAGPATSAPSDPKTTWEALLAELPSMDVTALAERMGVSVTTARKRLRILVQEGVAGSFQRGRSKHFWAKSTGLRPDIDLDVPAVVAVAAIDHTRAQLVAASHRRTRTLGLIGADETVTQLSLQYLPLFHVPFEEQVQRNILMRAIGPSHDRIQGSVYLHPIDLRLLVLDGQGIRFMPQPAPYASQIADLDGAVQWSQVAPVSLSFDESVWAQRKSLEDAAAHVAQAFPVAVGAATVVFLPYWHLVLSQDGGNNYRVVQFDAIVGKLIDFAAVSDSPS